MWLFYASKWITLGLFGFQMAYLSKVSHNPAPEPPQTEIENGFPESPNWNWDIFEKWIDPPTISRFFLSDAYVDK